MGRLGDITTEIPLVSEVEGYARRSWKVLGKVKIIEMNGGFFLFDSHPKGKRKGSRWAIGIETTADGIWTSGTS